MDGTRRIACIQMNGTGMKDDLLQLAERLVSEAAGRGATIVLLPEKWNGYGSPALLRTAAERLEDGETVAAMRAWARRHGVAIVGGSITESRDADGEEVLSNTCLVIARDGSVSSVYRKIHMFDVEIGGESHRESDDELAGSEIVQADVLGWKVGLSICYDLRFPELYRIHALSGALLATVPAAFTAFTGKDHWEVLLRARAIENQFFVAAANQHGPHLGGKASYGRSMIVDPWGIVLAQAPDGDCVIVADVDLQQLGRIRAGLPSLANRRQAAYAWPDDAGAAGETPTTALAGTRSNVRSE